MVTRCDGSSYTRKCIFALSNNGKSRNLLNRPAYSSFCWTSNMVLAREWSWIDHVILGRFYRNATKRFTSFTCLLNSEPTWTDHEFNRCRFNCFICPRKNRYYFLYASYLCCTFSPY